MYRYYLLDAFTNTDVIAATYLSDLQTDFNIARQAGVKMIIRFAYTITPDTNCGAAACPPYGDVPKSRVLAHIAQLKPYLQNNADVLSVVQAGFIGVWGENYYTDHFGDPSPNGDGRILDSNWVKRNEVLSAVLDAVPVERMVQVRYPQLKQRYIYGIDAPPGSAPLEDQVIVRKWYERGSCREKGPPSPIRALAGRRIGERGDWENGGYGD